MSGGCWKTQFATQLHELVNEIHYARLGALSFELVWKGVRLLSGAGFDDLKAGQRRGDATCVRLIERQWYR